MKRTFEEQLMEECNVLELLLEESTDEEQSKAIRNMLVSIAEYLNHYEDWVNINNLRERLIMNKSLDEVIKQLKDIYENIESHCVNYIESEKEIRRLTKLEFEKQFKGEDKNE